VSSIAGGGSRTGAPPLARRRRAALAIALAALLAALSAAEVAAAAHPRVLATHLDNPRKLFVAADGAVYVVEAGSGGRDRCFTDAGAKTCVGLTGAVTRVFDGRQQRVVSGLPSAASADGTDAEGPAAVVVTGKTYTILVGDGRVDATSARQLGRDGALSGDLISTGGGAVAARVLANFGAFEAAHDPDHGAGPGATAGDPALDSNPYALTRYDGGYAVVDAAGNDLLWLSPRGVVSVLAVFPTQRERVAAGVLGKSAETLTVQSVPTSVTVGPDGALYVGELTGFPFEVGKARVWRVSPGRKPTVYASGFTNISDLAFDGKNLLVLEIASRGLRDSHSPGALIRVAPNGARTLLLGTGLVAPTGLAVANGSIYIANDGTSPGSASGHGGELISIPA
jgi:hypothetical protein